MPNKINASELSEDLMIFGNKGNCHTGNCHIYKSSTGNLCGTPALSTNWARINNIQLAGYPECIEEFNKLKSK